MPTLTTMSRARPGDRRSPRSSGVASTHDSVAAVVAIGPSSDKTAATARELATNHVKGNNPVAVTHAPPVVQVNSGSRTAAAKTRAYQSDQLRRERRRRARSHARKSSAVHSALRMPTS